MLEETRAKRERLRGDMDMRERTRRAGVRVPSTSKRQIVFLTGRSSRGGNSVEWPGALAVEGSMVAMCSTEVVVVMVDERCYGDSLCEGLAG